MPFIHRTLDSVEVPPPRPIHRPGLRLAALAALVAVVFLVAGSMGKVNSPRLRDELLGWVGAGGFLITGLFAVRRVADQFYRALMPRTGPAHASVIRLLATIAGFVIVLLTALGMVNVPVQRLLLGGALTGVIIGIAAQQALGNLFAGLVLLLARPFNIGDDVLIRSGALGGTLTGRVTGMGMTYVTLQMEDGPLSVPNSALLAAGIGPARLNVNGPRRVVQKRSTT